MALHVATRTSLHLQWIAGLLCWQPSSDLSEVSRMLTHLLTDDLVVETQIAGGGSADLSSSIWAKEKDITGLNDPKYSAVNHRNMGPLLKKVWELLHFICTACNQLINHDFQTQSNSFRGLNEFEILLTFSTGAFSSQMSTRMSGLRRSVQ